MNDDEKRIAEYKEAAADIRLHSTILWGELTVYLAVAGWLVQAVASQSRMRPLAIVGMLLSVAFWLIVERCYDWVRGARDRAKKLEEGLGFSLYSSAPAPWIPRARAIYVCRMIFATGFLGWLAALISMA